MRKHSARKWLHFILDLLPIFIIPIYALFTINHDTTSLTIEETISRTLDFNQRVVNGDFSSDLKWINNARVSGTQSTFTYNEHTLTQSYDSVPLYSYGSGIYQNFTDYRLQVGHQYYFKIDYCTNQSGLNFTGLVNYYGSIQTSVASDNVYTKYSIINTVNGSSNNQVVLFYVNNSTDIEIGTFIKYKNAVLVDLTQMYGSGNEPSINEFELMLEEPNYPYIDSLEIFDDDYTSVVYDNTDIGSQFVYSMYIPVRDYFNFNNVFNFGAIYHWFEVSIFGGTAPMSFFIVWNIVLYEFVMDLVFLIYGLFMWFIDMCEKLMDKPLNSTK